MITIIIIINVKCGLNLGPNQRILKKIKVCKIWGYVNQNFKVGYEVTSTFFSIEILNTLLKICIKHKCWN